MSQNSKEANTRHSARDASPDIEIGGIPTCMTLNCKRGKLNFFLLTKRLSCKLVLSEISRH